MKLLQNPISSPASAEFVSCNDDLLELILLRLAPKPLIRFKCVSKHWHFLISSPTFGSRHTRLRSGDYRISGVLLRTNSPSIRSQYQFLTLNPNSVSSSSFRNLDFVHHPAGIKILQSCNGLLLCSSFREIGSTRNYYVFNPTTKQFNTLPPLRGGSDSSTTTMYGVSLAFDPCTSPNYKVIAVRSSESSILFYQIEIYSSDDRSWRISGSPFTAPFDMVFDNGVFWNGGIHWISPSRSCLAFDVDKETLGSIPTPPASGHGGDSRRFRYFGESHGHLHFFEIYRSNATQFKVFEMEKDSSKWFVKYNVDLNPVISAFPEIIRDHRIDPGDRKTYYAFVMLLLVREEDDKDPSMMIHIPGKIISHNLVDSKSLRKLYEEPPHEGKGFGWLQYGFLDAYEFIESLVPV